MVLATYGDRWILPAFAEIRLLTEIIYPGILHAITLDIHEV